MPRRDKAANAAYLRDWQRRNPGYGARRRRVRLASAAGRPPGDACEVCSISFATEGVWTRMPVFDHDHATGKFRGWICNECNKGLGSFKDSPETLRAAIDYLNRNK